eukprot:scaffold1649_cov134-Isochrysis_galbana.AAC.1
MRPPVMRGCIAQCKREKLTCVPPQCLREEEAPEVVKYERKCAVDKAEEAGSRPQGRNCLVKVWFHEGLCTRLVHKTEWDGKWVLLPDLYARVRSGMDVSEGTGTATSQPR